MTAQTDLLQSLMNLQGGQLSGSSGTGVAVPQGQPILQGENPLASALVQRGTGIPSATPAPHQFANPSSRQVTSLEDILFGGGFRG